MAKDYIERILCSWAKGRNVLLYGPPATGKTRLISELYSELSRPNKSTELIELDPLKESASALSRPERELPIPTPIKTVFTTFHQSYTYEDFVLGLKPFPKDGSIGLEPWAGLFLDAALELADPSSEFKSVVLFIDEINRGNAARIFGEFMTFLDFDYREDGIFELPLPLRQLKYTNGESEIIRRVGGKETKIPEGFLFPRNVYVVATMNSVDRAAVPIDSALARRFDRIGLLPDSESLLAFWELERDAIPDDAHWDELSPYEAMFRVFERLNDAIASDLGPEFELGHGLYMSIGSADSNDDLDISEIWEKVAYLWDDILFPQLEDRFSGREDLLLQLLKVDNPPQGGEYAWRKRGSGGLSTTSDSLLPVTLSELPMPTIARSFQWLSV